MKCRRLGLYGHHGCRRHGHHGHHGFGPGHHGYRAGFGLDLLGFGPGHHGCHPGHPGFAPGRDRCGPNHHGLEAGHRFGPGRHDFGPKRHCFGNGHLGFEQGRQGHCHKGQMGHGKRWARHHGHKRHGPWNTGFEELEEGCGFQGRCDHVGREELLSIIEALAFRTPNRASPQPSAPPAEAAASTSAQTNHQDK